MVKPSSSSPRRQSLSLRRALAALAAVALAGLPAFAAPAGGQAEPGAGLGTVVVVHGLEGIPADIYLDGAAEPALTGFEFRRVTEPLALPVGQHRADLRRAGDPSTAAPLLSGLFEVTAGQQVTVVALLDVTGEPTWRAFPDDGRRVTPEGAELRFRHVAATGPVSVELDGTPLYPAAANLAAADQLPPTPVGPGDHTITVQPADGGPPLRQVVQVQPGEIAVVHLTGRSANGSLRLLLSAWTQPDADRVAAAQVVPTGGVPSGNSGLAGGPGGESSPGPQRPASAAWLVLAAVALAGALGVARLTGSGPTAVAGLGTTGPSVGTVAAGPAPLASPAVADAGAEPWTGPLPAGAMSLADRRVVPVTVGIPSLGLTAPVVAVGIDDRGALDLPPQAGTIAWYGPGPVPGESGSAVLAGHVDYDGARGVFFRLADIGSGDEIVVSASDGSSRSFRVVGEPAFFPKASLPVTDLFQRGGSPVLTLITCGGAFDPEARSYEDNVVVQAVPAPVPASVPSP